MKSHTNTPARNAILHHFLKLSKFYGSRTSKTSKIFRPKVLCDRLVFSRCGEELLPLERIASNVCDHPCHAQPCEVVIGSSTGGSLKKFSGIVVDSQKRTISPFFRTEVLLLCRRKVTCIMEKMISTVILRLSFAIVLSSTLGQFL